MAKVGIIYEDEYKYNQRDEKADLYELHLCHVGALRDRAQQMLDDIG